MGDFSKIDKVVYDRCVTEVCAQFSSTEFLPKDIASAEGWRHAVRVARACVKDNLRITQNFARGLDSTPPARERALPDNVPIIVIMHGLTGG